MSRAQSKKKSSPLNQNININPTRNSYTPPLAYQQNQQLPMPPPIHISPERNASSHNNWLGGGSKSGSINDLSVDSSAYSSNQSNLNGSSTTFERQNSQRSEQHHNLSRLGSGTPQRWISRDSSAVEIATSSGGGSGATTDSYTGRPSFTDMQNRLRDRRHTSTTAESELSSMQNHQYHSSILSPRTGSSLAVQYRAPSQVNSRKVSMVSDDLFDSNEDVDEDNGAINNNSGIPVLPQIIHGGVEGKKHTEEDEDDDVVRAEQERVRIWASQWASVSTAQPGVDGDGYDSGPFEEEGYDDDDMFDDNAPATAGADEVRGGERQDEVIIVNDLEDLDQSDE